MRGVSCLLWMTVIDLWKQKSARPRLNRDSSHRLEVHFPLIDPRLSSSLVANCARPTLGVTSDNNEFIFPLGTLKKFYSLNSTSLNILPGEVFSHSSNGKSDTFTFAEPTFTELAFPEQVDSAAL